MITQKIKTLFQLIEFLHSNIDSFNQNNGLISEIIALNKERRNLKPEKNYKDRLKYNEIQIELATKFEVLQDKTTTPIKSKVKELNICDFSNEPLYKWNGLESDLRQLTESFNTNDLKEILKYKSQYIEYRTNTHESFLSLQLFFDELDEITKILFDYFKDSDINEYESFERKTIQVNSIKELAQLLSINKNKVKYPDKNLFIEQYSESLSEYLQNNPNDKEVDFVNYQLLEYKERLKELMIGLEKLNAVTSHPQPTIFKNIKNTQKRYINQCSSIVTFLEGKEESRTSQPHQIEEKQKEVFTFENNFDNVEPKDVYSHFKAGLVDNDNIDLVVLESFLKQAFEDCDKKDKPKEKIRMKNTTNSMKYIIEVFHKYYLKQVSKHGKKDKYVKLLTDNFIDFKYQKTHDNFRS